MEGEFIEKMCGLVWFCLCRGGMKDWWLFGVIKCRDMFGGRVRGDGLLRVLGVCGGLGGFLVGRVVL